VGQSSPSPGLKSSISGPMGSASRRHGSWIFGEISPRVESADSAYLASIVSYDDVLVTLLGDVASTYIGIRTLEKQIAIARENVVKQRGILAIARDRYKAAPPLSSTFTKRKTFWRD